MLNKLRLTFLLCGALALAGCLSGGSDGTGASTTNTSTPTTGTSTPAPAALAVSPPTANGTVGQVLSFVVTGGSPAYAVTSNSPAIAGVSSVGSAGGPSLFTATLAGVGSGTLIVTDASQRIISVPLTVSAPALLTSAPSALTIPIGGIPSSFNIVGGIAPYTASSTNNGVASAFAFGSTVAITGVASGTANVLVRDAGGSVSVTIAVTVASATPLFTSAPAAVSIAVGGIGNYTIAGGTAPYLVSSSNAAVASVLSSGPSFSITGLATGAASVSIRDSTGGAPTTIAVTVIFPPGPALRTTAPLALTIAAVGESQSYTISGGTPPYSASSDNTSIATANLNGAAALVIAGKSDGRANVSVQDATGAASVTIAVNVASGSGFSVIGSPSAWTIGGNGDGILTNDCSVLNRSPFSVYFINGGTPPYSVSSSKPLIGTILGVGSASNSFPTPIGAQQVNLNTVTVTENGGYFVVAWPNANNSCAAGFTEFKILDAKGLVPATTPTFTVTFTPS